MSECVILEPEVIVSEIAATELEVVELAMQGPPGPPSSGDMQSLIYDPRGIANDAFNISNLTGALDGGVFT